MTPTLAAPGGLRRRPTVNTTLQRTPSATPTPRAGAAPSAGTVTPLVRPAAAAAMSVAQGTGKALIPVFESLAQGLVSSVRRRQRCVSARGRLPLHMLHVPVPFALFSFMRHMPSPYLHTQVGDNPHLVVEAQRLRDENGSLKARLADMEQKLALLDLPVARSESYSVEETPKQPNGKSKAV
jgi:hypothetical protein